MKPLASVVQMIVRVSGVVQIVLGLLFWAGTALGLRDLHMLIGIVIVLLLWTLAALAATARVGVALPLTGFVVGLVTVWLGLTQERLVPGGGHWVIRVLHLLVGLAALGLADALGTRVKRSGAPATA
jgi:hypothetical protein